MYIVTLRKSNEPLETARVQCLTNNEHDALDAAKRISAKANAGQYEGWYAIEVYRFSSEPIVQLTK